MPSAEKRTILIVEDELLIATTTRKILGSQGYTTLHAATGEDAIDRCAAMTDPPDLVLMDLELGTGIDGVEAAQRINARHDIPIVFVSAHDDPRYASRMKTVASYGFVPKAAKPDVLLAAVTMAITLHESNRLRAEEARRFEAMKRSSIDAFLMVDGNGRITDVNDATVALTGYDRATLLTMHVAELDAEDGREYYAGLMRSLGEVAHVSFERTLRRPDGGTVDVAVRVTLVPEQGIAIGFMSDITDRKRRERSSEDAAELYRAMFTNTEAVHLLIDPMTGRIVDANAAAAEFYGYPLKELIGLKASAINTLPAERIAEEMARARLRHRNFFEFRHRDASGRVRDVEVYSSPIELSGRTFLNSIVFDVTDRRQARWLIEQERSRLTSIIEGTHVGTWEWNVQTGEVVFNERWAEMVGYTLDELRPITIDTWTRFAHPGDLKRSEAALEEHFLGKTPIYECEVRMRHKQGHWVWIQDRGRVREWAADKKPLRMFGTHQDITDRKNADEMIAASLSYHEAVIRAVPLGIFTFHEDGSVISANKAAAEIIGASMEELRRSNFRQFGSWKRNGLLEAVESVFRTGTERSLEIKGISNFGKEIWVDVRIVPLRDGPERHVMLVASEVGEQRRSEQRIRDLLEEKELLLREVHHRVKNNMSTMRSILSLQASGLGEGPAREVLKDSEKRLMSMMLLYDKLYQSTVMGLIRADDYLGVLLRDIVENSRRGIPISLTTEIQPIMVTARQMGPLGIIINELVSNAMKYAFLGRAEGSLRVAVVQEDDMIRLTVADDGVGLPHDIDARSSGGFGLQLVRLLTEQLEGTMEVVSRGGTQWILRFPLEIVADRTHH